MENENLGEARQTLCEVLTGIIFFTLLECLAGFIVSKDINSFILGTVLGAGSAIFFYMHLFYALDRALEKTEKEAVRYSKLQTVIRMVLMGVVIVIAFTFYEHVSVIMTFVGMMNVKFAAYLQPTTHKCINKIIKKKVR